MKFSGYWPVLLIVSLFYIKCIQTTDEFETESSDSNFVLPRAKFHYKTTAEHLDQKSMVGWYKMANGFISAVHSKSAETVDIIMAYFLRQKTFVVPQSIYELLKLHYALIACVVVGLLYIVIMWITGLIVFCCRCCCDNCGGKRVQDQTRTTSLWRKILILFLLILIVLLLIAVICMFVTHNSLSTNYSTSEKKTDILFEDMKSLLDNTRIVSKIHCVCVCVME
ncbi:prominin-1-like [Centruroides vittatus]|uniref:prominin-1-like n=1 Tax=Centruroides vittatus TaxID=120091 RepID=UPI00350F9195